MTLLMHSQDWDSSRKLRWVDSQSWGTSSASPGLHYLLNQLHNDTHEAQTLPHSRETPGYRVGRSRQLPKCLLTMSITGFPQTLWVPSPQLRSGVPTTTAGLLHDDLSVNPHPSKQPQSPPTPSHQLPLPVLPHQSVYGEPHGAGTCKLAFWMCRLEALTGHF